MTKVKSALVGYGHLGKWHAQKSEKLEACEFIAIVEPFEENQIKAKEAHPDLKIVSSLSDIWNEIDAVVIATPTSLHYEIVKQAIENNKHVFCEKPLCENNQEALELVELARGKDLVIQVGHSERYHKAWDEIQNHEILDEEDSIIKIDRIAAFKGRATDVDVVQDLMVHDIDLLMSLFSERPIAVKATGYKIRTDKWDHVQCEFIYNSPKQAFITVGRNYIEEKRSFEVMNRLGCLVVDLFQNKILIAPYDEVSKGVYVDTIDYEKRDHLFLEQEEFFNSILNSTRPKIDLKQGQYVVSIIDAVHKSLDTKEVVQL